MSTISEEFIKKNLIFNPAGNDDTSARSIIK